MASVPYSIGIDLIGDVIRFVIPSGVRLPASGEGRVCTTVDNQTSMCFNVFQGEHHLEVRAQHIGRTELTGLPPRRLGEVGMTDTIKYDEDGILHFSARQASESDEASSSGEEITATFRAKTTFTADDHNQFGVKISDEIPIANMLYERAEFEIDLKHAGQEIGELQEAVERWRVWLQPAKDNTAKVFEEDHHEALVEFHRLDPVRWPNPGSLRPDMQFKLVWPRRPQIISNGAAIVRFSTAPGFSRVRANIVNVKNRSETNDIPFCQFPVDGRIEAIVRLWFPAEGIYAVTLSAGRPNELLYRASELTDTGQSLHFEVEGAPVERRRLDCTEMLEMIPRESCASPGLSIGSPAGSTGARLW
jgi:hypothetical protein